MRENCQTPGLTKEKEELLDKSNMRTEPTDPSKSTVSVGSPLGQSASCPSLAHCLGEHNAGCVREGQRRRVRTCGDRDKLIADRTHRPREPALFAADGEDCRDCEICVEDRLLHARQAADELRAALLEPLERPNVLDLHEREQFVRAGRRGTTSTGSKSHTCFLISTACAPNAGACSAKPRLRTHRSLRAAEAAADRSSDRVFPSALRRSCAAWATRSRRRCRASRRARSYLAGRLDMSDGDVELGRERQHVGNGLGVRSVSNQDQLEIPLPRRPRGSIAGLRGVPSPARLCHRRRCRCGSRRMREGFDSR